MPRSLSTLFAIGLFFALWGWTYCPNAGALSAAYPHGEGAAGHPAALIFLKLATDDRGAQAERAFVQTLQLDVDDFTVERTKVADPRFAERAAQLQVEILYPLLNRPGVRAALWLSVGSNHRFTLHVATLERDRATIRLFRQPAGRDAPRELAHTAAQWFASYHLMETRSAIPPQAGTAGCPEAGIPQSQPFPRASAYAAIWAPFRLKTGTGPSHRIGASGGMWLDLTSHAALRIGIAGGVGPFGRTNRVAMRGGWVGGEADIFVGFSAGSTRLGPLMGVYGAQQFTTVHADERRASYRYALFAARLGASARFPVRRTRAGVGLGVELTPVRVRIVAASDGAQVYENPPVGWFLRGEWTFF